VAQSQEPLKRHFFGPTGLVIPTRFVVEPLLKLLFRQFKVLFSEVVLRNRASVKVPTWCLPLPELRGA
jgi:hypothetical protein